MKKLLVFIIFVCLNASSYDYVKNILGNDTFNTYKNLFYSSLDKNASLKTSITFLEDNGLLDLYFKKPKKIDPTFIFTDNNPLFNTKTLYDILNSLGIINFYPVFIQKNDSFYKITLEMKSNHYIDPLNLINSFEDKGCKITNIIKNENFTYYISCQNEKINAFTLKNKITALHKIKGIYWINPGNFSKIYIKTSKYDFFYPYIVFYDKNLNILNIITSKNIKRTLILNIPENTKYIKIKDFFTRENIKRGIFVKGLK